MISVKKVYYSYNDIFLIPKCTSLKSRSEASTNVKLGKFDLSIPFISANMDTITGPQMAMALWNLGAVGALHRFNDTKNAVSDYLEVVDNSGHHDGDCIVSIGVNKDYQNRAKALYSAGATVFLVDVAHGHSIQVKDTLKWLKTTFSDSITIIAGNVATPDAVTDLAQWGADIIKVGVGPGSVCKTRIVTGHGVPQFSCLLDCSAAADLNNVKIIADGGIRNSGDIVKSFVAGADYVMIGSLFAGTEQTPGEKHIVNNTYVKSYRGMASNDAQMLYKGNDTKLPAEEGITLTIPYKGDVGQIVVELQQGLKSGMSYCNAYTLDNVYTNAQWGIQTTSGYAEGTPHLKQ